MFFQELLHILCACVLIKAQQQSFLVQPSDVSVIQGQTAQLRCTVANKQGALQWTKDGFALGFSHTIPGFPTYHMVVNVPQGQYDLRITNVGIADDGEFSCQVGPVPGSPALHGVCHLNVLIPPSGPIVKDHSDGEEIRVGHKEKSVTLTCSSAQGKPAANLTWWRGDELLEEGIVYSKQIQTSKLESATSTLTFEPSSQDNGKWFRCVATNPAMEEGRTLSTRVKLNVMHPPNVPIISGYINGTVISTGDTLILTCVAHGGNPLAQVYWYKNGKELDFSYKHVKQASGGNRAENELSFTVQPNDNGAIYQCRASNLVTTEPRTAQVKLIVRFAPKTVTITGRRHAKAGEDLTLTCKTSISNPPANITWSSVGRMVKPLGTNTVTESPLGGFITTSQVKVKLQANDNNVVYMCIATNEVLGKTKETSVELQVMFPPQQPIISGYTGAQVMAGRILTMTCTSVGGNPLASLEWFKMRESLSSHKLRASTKVTGKIVTSKVSFILQPDDNGAQYQCQASNAATEAPINATKVLVVNFPPKSLQITTNPATPKANELLRINCTSATSNPASVVSWWKDGNQIKGTMDYAPKPSAFGGKTTTSVLTIRPGAEDDGEIYACRATNTLLERAVSDAITLDIRYKPHFPKNIPSLFNCVENKFTIVNVTVKANPRIVEYKWFRNKQKLIPGKLGSSSGVKGRLRRDVYAPTFHISKGVLNITNVSRTHAGPYTVEAGNAEGKVNFTFNLNVQYPAGIKKLSEVVIVDAFTSPMLTCEVDANPMTDKMVVWSRPEYDMSKTRALYDSKTGRSSLIVQNVTKVDSGIFICSATNGVGKPAIGKAHLVVKYAPLIDKSTKYGKAAAEKGSVAKLICLATGAPKISFNWYKGGALLDGPRYLARPSQPNPVLYKTELNVVNVTKLDYGVYTCEATNALGYDRRHVTLDGTSRPDEPSNLRFVNRTHDSITMSWDAGFDGGSSQWFQVRYNLVNEKAFKYEDVIPRSSQIYKVSSSIVGLCHHGFQVGGLKLGAEYELTVRGINSLGEGEFARIPLRTMTSATRPPGGVWGADPDDTPLIIILCVSIIGMVLLGLNVLLILFFIRRRRKRLENATSSDSASQPNTVEMYTAPTMTEDSKSHSTYGGRSIDGDYPNDDDEVKKIMPPPTYASNGLLIDAYGPKPDPYAAPRPDELYPARPGTDTPSPGVDPQRSLLGNGSAHRDVMFPYDTPRKYDPRDPDDERFYASQLRRNQMQRPLNGSVYDVMSNGRPPSIDLPPRSAQSTSQLYATPTRQPHEQTPPPPIPARVPLKPVAPPGVPPRNYEDHPRTTRYGPPPRTPPEMRGHLV